ncbi:MAG: DUF615 domain-containing protein [Candidatus Accumulibacter sp.]|jgi:ribosome-associated protein|nr:DUF615 domain-containing protein [Accumulibacter sp.]
MKETPELSKTQRKRAMEELQELGQALAALPAERREKIDLPEELTEAIEAYRRMTRQNEARRRQMQYIGRLMRGVDAEPIRAALAEARGESAAGAARQRRLERLRDALLADESALTQIAALYPAIDLQALATLRRAALKEQQETRPPRHYRAIYRLLKEADEGE